MTCRSIVVCDKCGKELPIQVWGTRIRMMKVRSIEEDEFDLCEECYDVLRDSLKEWLDKDTEVDG